MVLLALRRKTWVVHTENFGRGSLFHVGWPGWLNVTGYKNKAMLLLSDRLIFFISLYIAPLF